jgi:hypothetical protein
VSFHIIQANERQLLLKTGPRHVGSKFLKAVGMKSAILWAIMPCSLLKFNDVLEDHVAFTIRVEE